MPRKAVEKEVEKVEDKMVEVEANGGGSNHTLFFADNRVEFVAGKALVLESLVKELKKAKLIK